MGDNDIWWEIMHELNYMSLVIFSETGSEMRSLGAGFQSRNCWAGAKLRLCSIVPKIIVFAF